MHLCARIRAMKLAQQRASRILHLSEDDVEDILNCMRQPLPPANLPFPLPGHVPASAATTGPSSRLVFLCLCTHTVFEIFLNPTILDAFLSGVRVTVHTAAPRGSAVAGDCERTRASPLLAPAWFFPNYSCTLLNYSSTVLYYLHF